MYFTGRRTIPSLVFAMLTLQLLLLAACGDPTVLPSDAKISVNSQTLKNPPSGTSVDFHVVTTYSDGKPMPWAKIRISGTFAEPNSGAVYQFYYYPGGTNVANTPVDSPFQAQTNEFGVYNFSITVDGTVFKDTVTVSSGAAIGTGTIEVTTGT